MKAKKRLSASPKKKSIIDDNDDVLTSSILPQSTTRNNVPNDDEDDAVLNQRINTHVQNHHRSNDVAIASCSSNNSTTSSSDSTSSDEDSSETPNDSNSSNNNNIDSMDYITINNDTIKTDGENSSSKIYNRGHSVLYAPYRTLGVVTNGAPFHLIPNQNSSNALLCCSLGDRFCLYRTQHLQPALISQTVPAVTKSGNTPNNERTINYCLTDSSMSITIVAHGPTVSSSGDQFRLPGNNKRTDSVTLYQRTRPTQTLRIASTKLWNIQDMILVGKVKQSVTDPEKEGKVENSLIIAVILGKNQNIGASKSKNTDEEDDDDDDNNNIVRDSDDESSDDESGTDDDSVDESDDDDLCMGKIVVLVATRRSLRIESQIPIKSVPDFWPNTAIHPATYLNKIVVGGHSTTTKEAAMVLVNIKSKRVIHKFTALTGGQKEKGKKFVAITSMEQSPAVDTIAVGTNRGIVHLINIRLDVKLFSLHHDTAVAITSISFRNDGGAMQYGIAPMAVGRSDGSISVWDLTAPEDSKDTDSDTINSGRVILTELNRIHLGGVSKVQYLPNEPLLLSTGFISNSLMVHIFDNPDHSGRILRQRSGHTASPCLIRYKNGFNSLLANAADGTDPSLSCNIISTGGPDRTVRSFSTVRSVLDKELSQGKGLQKKAKKFGLDTVTDLLLPRVVGLSMCDARDRRGSGWCDLVTIHENHSMAYLWSTKDGSQAGPVLRQNHWNVSAMKQQPPPSTHATSVAISSCGNLAIVGTKGGTIYKYNIQSGIPRGSYPVDATDNEDPHQKSKMKLVGNVTRTMKALEKSMKINDTRRSNLDKQDYDLEIEMKREEYVRSKIQVASHTGYAVTGLAVDATNKTLVSVGSDSKLIVWQFSKHTPHKKCPIQLPASATKLLLNRDSDLAAIALEDFSIILFDCTALSIVRRFGTGAGSNACHTDAICDIGFSPDGRTLFSASKDGTIRVWDIPSNTCMDWLSFKSHPTSITISPTGEFLATTHVGKLGISLWSDKSFYRRVDSDVYDLSRPFLMDEPTPLGYDDTDEAPGNQESKLREQLVAKRLLRENDDDVEQIPAVPKAKGLITLSGLPPAHWKNLFHLELVKERNKPDEAPKKPPSAPFFLQWRKGESLVAEGNEAEAKPIENSKQDDPEEWAAAWSDDDDDDDFDDSNSNADKMQETRSNRNDENYTDKTSSSSKRRKITHARSHLASLLLLCKEKGVIREGELRYQEVNDYVSTLGPSAIDVALSTLCNGGHDLEEGLPLLLLTCDWLHEACQSREKYEAINAYLHRFLYLHATVIAGIEQNDVDIVNVNDTDTQYKQDRAILIEKVSELRQVQHVVSENLRNKMEHTLCLLRHFSRMI